MGNKLGRRKQVVEEKYTKPQGLYEIRDVDYKRLRKLILDEKLAPCYPGVDDHDFGYEECPICFMYYPTLNRSRCCTKSICTECFLQMKNPSSTRPTQCPFCKALNYAVEYRGVKSKEEKGIEQIEEQKVIEAKIRMQQQQRQEEEERRHRKDERSPFNGSSMARNPSYGISEVVENFDVSPSRDSSSIQMLRQAQNAGQYRDEEFDVDLEDIMVMEAIWLSIQENGGVGQSSTNAVSNPTTSGDYHVSREVSSSSSYGDIACSVSPHAEHRHFREESSTTYGCHVSHPDMLPSSSRTSKNAKKNQHHQISTIENSDHENIERICSIQRAKREFDHGSMTSPHSTRVESDGEDGGEDFFDVMTPHSLPRYNHGGGFQDGLVSTSMIPEGFDEQVMLAMAISIAEAGARTPAPGVAWP